VVWLALGVVLSLAAPAGATSANVADICESDAECAAHSEKGRALYANKKFDEALREFAIAYRTQHEPLLLLNLGRCYYRLGQPKVALTYYHRFQKQVPEPSDNVAESLQRYMAEAHGDGKGQPHYDLINVTGGHEAIAGKPFYKTWWFWTATGAGVAAIALGVGLGVGLSHPGQPSYVDFAWR
jgi:tetratricopeptide (TPR) repeat protein